MASAVGTTDIFKATDGKEYVVIRMTGRECNSATVRHLQELMDYVNSLERKFHIVVDGRKASPWGYLKHAVPFLRRLDRSPGECVEAAELWLNENARMVLGLIAPLVSRFLESSKLRMRCVKDSVRI